MLKTKRKRAVVLALIAFFCIGATTFVAVDWKRFGGGFLAFLRGKGDTAVATNGAPGGGSSHAVTSDAPSAPAPAPQRVAIASTRKHTSGAPHGTGGGVIPPPAAASRPAASSWRRTTTTAAATAARARRPPRRPVLP